MLLEESRGKSHAACDLAHFFCGHFVYFVDGFVDCCCYEVFEHFEVFRVDDVAVEVDGLDLFFAVDDDFDGAAARAYFDGAFFDLVLHFYHFSLHFLNFFHHGLHVSHVSVHL